MELLVTIRDKIATYAEMRPYVCGNSDYVIHFDMDEEWAAHETKTARFVKDDGTYHDQVFTGNDCPVPVISNTFSIRVGVYAGDLHTTTPAYIPAKKSILCGSSLPAAPSDDVYAQIMEHLNQIEQNGVSDAEIKAAIEAYLIENPIEGVTPEEVEAAIEKYMQEHPVLVEESDPTVPDWAKQPEKPTYTAQEVGAQPKGDYALKSEIPNVPVQSVNGQTGNVQLAIPLAYELPTASADTKGGVKVGSGLQMTGDVLGVKEEKLELIETITLEEDVASVERSVEPDGKPYNFKAIYIFIETAPGTVLENPGYIYVYSKGSAVGRGYLSSKATAGKYYSACFVYPLYGWWRTQFDDTLTNPSTLNVYRISNEGSHWVKHDTITNPNISKILIAQKQSAGTIINIWGVRADA